MLPLYVAVNAPRRITLAGVNFLISALPLSTFGSIQAWMLDRLEKPEPIDLSFANEEATDPETMNVLRFARDLALFWPPRVGSYAWMVLLDGMDDGKAHLVWEAVRVHREGFTESEVRILVTAGPTDEEWVAFLRTCLHGDPYYQGPKIKGDPRKSISTDDWQDLFGVLGSLKGWTAGQIASMTFPQIRCVIDQMEREAGKMGGPRTSAAQARAALDAVKSGRFGGSEKNGNVDKF